jgi:hypothetical protein
MSEPSSDLARITFRCKEKKMKENMETKREEDECADNQQNAQNEGERQRGKKNDKTNEGGRAGPLHPLR